MVLTATGQDAHRTLGVFHVTGVGMTIAHATTADRDILNRIEITTCHCRILTSHRHQMAQQVLGTQQAYAHISGTSPFLQHRRVEIVRRRGTIVQQHNGNLAIFQWHDFRIFRRTDNIVVLGDGLVSVLAKVGLTIGRCIGEMLPRRPCLAVITGFLQSP